MEISVIVPVYNVEKYLPKCLDSLCAQADCVKEIILINDGSTDNSLQICQTYAGKDCRIRIINQENKGLSATVRIGVKEAGCEYIGFVDGDDYIETNMYEVMAKAMLDNNADVVICNHDTINEEGQRSKPIEYWKTDKMQYVFTKQDGKFDCPIYPTLKNQKYFPQFRVNKLMRKDSIIQNLTFKISDVCNGEDIAFTLPILFAAHKIVYVRGAFYHYLQRSDSIAHKYNRRNLKDWHSILSVLERAQKEYRYKINDFDGMALVWLISCCLYKIKISVLSLKQKSEEYKYIGGDEEVKRLLTKTGIKANIKYRIVLNLLKRRMYNILALIY